MPSIVFKSDFAKTDAKGEQRPSVDRLPAQDMDGRRQVSQAGAHWAFGIRAVPKRHPYASFRAIIY